MDNAFEYVEDNGITLSSNYPYTATDNACTYDPNTAAAHLSSHVNVAENDPAALMAAAAIGPVSVAVNAGSLGW